MKRLFSIQSNNLWPVSGAQINSIAEIAQKLRANSGRKRRGFTLADVLRQPGRHVLGGVVGKALKRKEYWGTRSYFE